MVTLYTISNQNSRQGQIPHTPISPDVFILQRVSSQLKILLIWNGKISRVIGEIKW